MIVRYPYKGFMVSEREQFEHMLDVLMQFVDAVNEEHAQGVCFGEKHRLFPAEIHTIVAIELNEGIGLTQLAEKLDISKPTLSERIRKLVTKGYVTKRKNPADQKAVQLHLTSDGKDAAYHHELHHQKMYETFSTYFGDESSHKIEMFTKTFTELSRFEQLAVDKS